MGCHSPKPHDHLLITSDKGALPRDHEHAENEEDPAAKNLPTTGLLPQGRAAQ